MAHASVRPPELVHLCEHAATLFGSLRHATLTDRGRRISEIRAVLAEIARVATELEAHAPGFAREQGWLVDAASALQSIDLDRGGPRVDRFIDRAVADLHSVAACPVA